MLSNTTTPNQTSNHFNDQLNLLDKLLDDIDKLDELDRLPPPKKRSSNRNRNENGNGYRIRAKAPPFPIPTPPELREWANRHRQVRIALPVSNSDSGSDSGATQLAIVSPYSEEQEPPLLVSSSSMGAGSGIGTPSSSSDDGPLTPDSDQIHGGHGVPGFGYFTSQRKAEVSVDEDQDQDSMVFGTIGKKSKLTSSLRAPYRSLKAGREEAVRVEHVKADEVKVKVEVVKREETKAEVIEGAKVVERPPQTLPPPEWTGGQEWRKFRYMDKETSEPKETFDIHSWGAASKFFSSRHPVSRQRLQATHRCVCQC